MAQWAASLSPTSLSRSAAFLPLASALRWHGRGPACRSVWPLCTLPSGGDSPCPPERSRTGHRFLPGTVPGVRLRPSSPVRRGGAGGTLERGRQQQCSSLGANTSRFVSPGISKEADAERSGLLPGMFLRSGCGDPPLRIPVKSLKPFGASVPHLQSQAYNISSAVPPGQLISPLGLEKSGNMNLCLARTAGPQAR